MKFSDENLKILSDTISWQLPGGFVAIECQCAREAARTNAAATSGGVWANKDRSQSLKIPVVKLESPFFKLSVHAVARSSITVTLLATGGAKIEWIDCGRKKTYRFRYAKDWTYRFEPENRQVALRWGQILDFTFEPGAPFLGSAPEDPIKILHFECLEVYIMRDMLPPRFWAEEKDKRFDRAPGSLELVPSTKEETADESDDEDETDIDQEIVN